MDNGQYSYVAPNSEYRREYLATSKYNEQLKIFENDNMTEPRLIAKWDQHVNLHQWMYQLYLEKGYTGEFYNDDLELTRNDIDRLENDLKNGKLRDNWRNGVMFGVDFHRFGSPTDDINYEYDLDFCINAKAEMFFGLKVFYTSYW